MDSFSALFAAWDLLLLYIASATLTCNPFYSALQLAAAALDVLFHVSGETVNVVVIQQIADGQQTICCGV